MGGGPTLIVGDFKLAPRLEDGVFGTSPSKFTGAGERKAFRALLTAGVLFDATCPAKGKRPEFTFERLVKDQTAASGATWRWSRSACGLV